MSERDLIRDDIDAYLERYESRELLRFVTVGSVDDGKSTLIGRLLHDANGVYEDQLRAVQRASSMEGAEIDFSLFTDGLKAEREQGITIDVAYRYFSTAKRKFIIADTPGHIQYTRNMVTGASTADVAVILIDARLGVLEQSRRHAFVASMLGIRHLLVAVNKMDLVDYADDVFEAIHAEFEAFTRPLGYHDVTFIPVSALRGENIVSRASSLPWYSGPTVLEYLESVPIANDSTEQSLRFPVQIVLRPNLNYRGFAGRVAAGTFRRGDTVMILPSRRTTTIRSIDTYDGEIASACAPMSVTLRLADEVDVSRGDMIVAVDGAPVASRRFVADIVWLHDAKLDLRKSYLLKHTTQRTRAQISRLESRLDLSTLERVPCEALALNDIGRVEIAAHRALFVDPYQHCRSTGAFVLIDPVSNATVGAGMIVAAIDSQLAGGRASIPPSASSGIERHEREERSRQRATLVVLAGGTAELRRTLALAIERELFEDGWLATSLGGANGIEAQAAPAVIHAVLRLGAIATCDADDGASQTVASLAPEQIMRVRIAERTEAEAPRALGREQPVDLDVNPDDGVDAMAAAVCAALRSLGRIAV